MSLYTIIDLKFKTSLWIQKKNIFFRKYINSILIQNNNIKIKL